MRDGKQTPIAKWTIDREQWTVETQWDRLSSLSDDAWKGVPKWFFHRLSNYRSIPE